MDARLRQPCLLLDSAVLRQPDLGNELFHVLAGVQSDPVLQQLFTT